MEISFDVVGLRDFRDVARALGREGRQIPKRVAKVINKEAKYAAKQAKAKALAIPTEGDKHTGLRSEVAAGVKVVPTDTGATVTTSMAEEDEQYIPRGLDTDKGWQHPFFGDRDKWVRQYNPGHFSWFTETMNSAREPIADGIHEVLEDAADAIDRESPFGGR